MTSSTAFSTSMLASFISTFTSAVVIGNQQALKLRISHFTIHTTYPSPVGLEASHWSGSEIGAGVKSIAVSITGYVGTGALPTGRLKLKSVEAGTFFFFTYLVLLCGPVKGAARKPGWIQG
ncbi:hypothetical protein BGX38DRAFT_261643 [Terfezia claveryi]|nr:hypothetical protein BGX38DRAFT_261643 [Terfezia claveryi]